MKSNLNLESTSDYSKLNDKLIAILEGTDVDSPSEKKKSGVTFNELVERIEVLSDDDLKDTNLALNDSDDDDKDSRL